MTAPPHQPPPSRPPVVDGALPRTAEWRRGAVDELVRREPVFAAVVARCGEPPRWVRAPGFATLLLIVLEQQVSLASARATFDRLTGLVDPVTAPGLLRLDDAQLAGVGFSRQKARYGRALATAVADGTLDLDALAGLDDADVDTVLQALPGVGPWTSTIYRLMALDRPDAWPVGDIALAQATAELWRLPARPSQVELTARAEAWRPWRAMAARLLWHHYLTVRRRPAGSGTPGAST